MGLRGAHARQPQRNVAPAAPAAWKRKRTRVGRVVAFLESLPITKGIYAGKKMKLLPGQRRFIEAVYGRVAADGRRQIRIAIKSEPRGNGKTGLLAGLALCHLLGPECEVRGEVYSCAFNKLQAALIFAEMRAIIEATSEFDGRCNLQRYGKVMKCWKATVPASFMAFLPTTGGRSLAPSFWIFDEYAQSPNSDLLDTLPALWASAASLGVIISTQAANDLHPLSQSLTMPHWARPSVYRSGRRSTLISLTKKARCNEALGKFLDLNEFRAGGAGQTAVELPQ
jgi:phage terminase large subunit-like protein